MFAGRELGALVEPLSGRRWDRQEVYRQVMARACHIRRLGVGPDDRVFLHSNNTLEVLADLLAIWSVGACAIPLDSRLTAYEVETLAAAARPKLALWKDDPDSGIAERTAQQGCRVEMTLPENFAGAPPDPPAQILRRRAGFHFSIGML